MRLFSLEQKNYIKKLRVSSTFISRSVDLDSDNSEGITSLAGVGW